MARHSAAAIRTFPPVPSPKPPPLRHHPPVPAPLAPLLGFSLGVLLAWFARPEVIPDEPTWDRSALAVVLYAVLVYAPACAYFVIFAGDWSFAYHLDSRT